MIRDLSLAAKALVPPRVVLFDWHATLVDTLDAMYHAVDDVLPQLPALGLMAQLMPPERWRSAQDGRLVDYVRTHLKLHPKIKADRKISRTDIFEILFGDNEDAKHAAHEAFNQAYRNHYGEVHPFEGGELALLRELHEYDVKLGILTNRDREFFEHEFAIVEDGAWLGAVRHDDLRRRYVSAQTEPGTDPESARGTEGAAGAHVLVCRRQCDGRRGCAARRRHGDILQWCGLGPGVARAGVSGHPGAPASTARHRRQLCRVQMAVRGRVGAIRRLSEPAPQALSRSRAPARQRAPFPPPSGADYCICTAATGVSCCGAVAGACAMMAPMPANGCPFPFDYRVDL